MHIGVKLSALTIVLALPLLIGCEVTPDSSTGSSTDSTRLTGPDPNKPQLEAHSKSGGFVVTPSFTGPLLASGNTLPTGSQVTLTISTNIDVGPTPYYIEIFDMRSHPDAGWGTLVAICGWGTTCSTKPLNSYSWPYSAYIAYVGGYASDGSMAPPPNVVATSTKAFVTWTDTGYTVTLPTQADCLASTTSQITATTNVDVGPTPYWIEIFDQNANRLANCPNGTTCSATYMCGSVGLYAFISNLSTYFPPAFLQASSNTVIPQVHPQ